jgi:hypothetical protein
MDDGKNLKRSLDGSECFGKQKHASSKLNISLGVRLVFDTTSHIVGKDGCSRTNVGTISLAHL